MLTVLSPLGVEAFAVRRGLGGDAARVVRTGMGPARSRAAAERLAAARAETRGPLAIAGVCGGVAAGLRGGDVVVATALTTLDGGELALAGADVLAAAVRRLGLRCTTGAVLSVERLQRNARAAAVGRDVLAIDMESVWLAAAAGDAQLAVLRVVADNGGRSIYHPRLLVDGVRALGVLRRAAPALAEWAAVPAGVGLPQPTADRVRSGGTSLATGSLSPGEVR